FALRTPTGSKGTSSVLTPPAPELSVTRQARSFLAASTTRLVGRQRELAISSPATVEKLLRLRINPLATGFKANTSAPRSPVRRLCRTLSAWLLTQTLTSSEE